MALSIGLGLSAKEIAALTWTNVFEQNGSVRAAIIVPVKASNNANQSDIRLVPIWSRRVRRILSTYGERNGADIVVVGEAPLFPSRKGGHLTATSMRRFIKDVYRDAGIPEGGVQSGRKTLIADLMAVGLDARAVKSVLRRRLD